MLGAQRSRRARRPAGPSSGLDREAAQQLAGDEHRMRTLRATAPAYVPLALRKQEEDAAGRPSLLELPQAVLALVLSKLNDCKDALSAGRTCKAMLGELAVAPATASLAGNSKAATMPSSQATAYVAEVSSSLCKYMPGLTGLDLSGLYVDESDVLHLCAGLACLRTLSLAGCKKLTGALCDAVAGPSTPTPHLQALDLQRCFQLTSGSLAAFLRSPASAGVTGSGVSGHAATGPRFQFLGLSHLNLSQFQLHLSDQTSADYDDNIVPDTHTAQAVAAAAGRGDGSRDVDGPDVNSAPLATSSYTTALSAAAGSSLRILALHNCTQLSAGALLQIAAACPQLQLLLLGGGAFTQRTGPVHAATHDLSHQLRPLIPTGTSATCVVEAVYQAVDSSPALCACKASTPIRNHLSMVSVSLVATALCLPKLQVLELTFMPPTVVPTVTRALELLRDELRLPTTPHVWDLTQQDSVQAALDMLHAARAADASAPSGAPAAVPHLAAALKCAVNCSSSARTTPLHTAAFGGAAGTVRQLLQLGAICDARDVGGATALFLSAEAGHHEVVQALLKAEGDLSLGNAAGESPLYIAALKGHLEVVRLLVQGFVQRRLPWHEMRYCAGSDGWTPLMAAVLANRFNVAQWLLAAGADAAPALTKAANRYGQSALHIAARKGSVQMLSLLLSVGGPSALKAADASGETPIDVALKHSHMAAVAEFRRACALA